MCDRRKNVNLIFSLFKSDLALVVNLEENKEKKQDEKNMDILLRNINLKISHGY